MNAPLRSNSQGRVFIRRLFAAAALHQRPPMPSARSKNTCISAVVR